MLQNQHLIFMIQGHALQPHLSNNSLSEIIKTGTTYAKYVCMHNMVHMRVCMHVCGASGGKGVEGECVWRYVCGGACMWWGVLVVGRVCVCVCGGGGYRQGHGRRGRGREFVQL